MMIGRKMVIESSTDDRGKDDSGGIRSHLMASRYFAWSLAICLRATISPKTYA